MEKLERLGGYLAARDLSSVWFARHNSFAWLTGGSNVIERSTDAGVAAIGYDGSTVTLLANNIEAGRIVDEELPDLDRDVRVETFPWHEASLEEALADRVDGPAAADVPVPGMDRLDPTPLRQPLTETDRERYRALGEETATAVESACRELRPDDTEHEVATAVRVALEARGIEAPVLLVGGSERAQRYRHFTATRSELGSYALVSVTAKRHGLHASCTRTVAFDPPGWLEERHEAAARVETTALAATRAAAGPNAASPDDAGQEADDRSGTAAEVFAAVRRAYDGVGWEGEWRNHHQGGAAGFAGREWIATPDLDAPVRAPMAYAWNPTVQGAKSEDTALVTDEGVEVLTATGSWPTITARALDVDRGLDLELERPAVLTIDG